MGIVKRIGILTPCLTLTRSGASGASDTATAVPPPTILFAIADDGSVHADASGTKGIQTPALDRVAREGLLFTHAYTPNAKCAPSHACILTGRSSTPLKGAANYIGYFPPECASPQCTPTLIHPG